MEKIMPAGLWDLPEICLDRVWESQSSSKSSSDMLDGDLSQYV